MSTRRGTVRFAAAVLVVVSCAATAGCSGTTGSAAASAASSSSAPAPSSSPSPSPGGAGHTHATSAASTAGAEEGPAAGVRLQALLGQHAVLAADMMRARMRQDPDFAQAAEAALTRNTQELSSLLGSLLGADPAARFAQRWTAHVTDLYAYAEARRSDDRSALARARRQLGGVEQDLAGFFAEASHGRMSRQTALQGVRMHVDELLGQADAYRSRDYATAATAYRAGYEHAFGLGGALARALLPAADATALGTPGWQLRSNLTQALGEHVAVVVAAMRAASGPGAQDFRALGAELNANTTALATAVGTLFGSAAAVRFQSLWADHVDALMDLTAAAAHHDDAGQQDARRRLSAFEPALAAFLDTATASRVGAEALARAYADHDGMLVDEVKAYQAQDYTRAHDLGYRAFSEMADLAGQLSHAIELTLAGRLPRGGSQTGGGGTAP